MLLSQMTGDGGNAITLSAILWLRYENIPKGWGSASHTFTVTMWSKHT